MKELVPIDLGNFKINTPLDEIFFNNFDRCYYTYYNKSVGSTLSALCDKYGSDKGEIRSFGHPYPWPSHTYADFIERTFGHCKKDIKFIFECGIGTKNLSIEANMGQDGKPGASLRVWRDFFSTAQIVGADIDKEILFSEDRIRTFFCDQTDRDSIKYLWDQVDISEFDLMIDDGLHTFEAGVCLLENSYHKLRSGGLYIIEDVSVQSLFSFKNYFDQKINYVYDFVNLYRRDIPLADNSLVVLRKP